MILSFILSTMTAVLDSVGIYYKHLYLLHFTKTMQDGMHNEILLKAFKEVRDTTQIFVNLP